VGRIPAGWEVVSLGSIIATAIGGVSVNGENRHKGPGEIGVLKVSAVSKGMLIPSEHKTVIKDDLERVKQNPIKDHILFSRANTPQLVGESAYISKTYTDLFLSDKLWMIGVKDRKTTHVKWLSYVLCSGKVKRIISDIATGTSGSMKNISKPSLLSIHIAQPSFQEQVKIAESIDSVDFRLNHSNEKLARLTSIKKALMQDLLTGKVRVKIDENKKEPAAA
jgi:type I restriction enzyme S subunit